MKKILILFFIVTSLTMADYLDTWDELLQKYASAGEKDGVTLVVVDYRGLKQDLKFEKLLKEVRVVEIKKIEGDELKAFWINTYNIGAVKMIVDNYPIDGIKDAGSVFKSVWNKEIIEVGDKIYSLGEIENKILRRTGDELIHFAIVCASVSCPDLKMSGYRGEELDRQLLEQKLKFMEEKNKGIYREGDIVYLSKIFKWYKEDFGNIREYLGISEDKKIKYLDYNWGLNGLNL
ncbi:MULTISPECIES: DUF547 domain-containing protein [Psychrilyobacter]|uniref:DUF547 domain-containing protein n=1 Tax=Psychrilyobacter piezotolerans TaxID=2293438 RepID=A0ABX9KK47_9FUSO|nr:MULTISPECIES: DUF547 domain-containing protein [Psychrilyobacter]MCS5420875.1 DUF547 domain-containing protein [Psychrilyobacter sp. S5]NDI76806.1 DUF547 domain-containing protein [Psychrilyobacter piezotolerans]RDE65090.1 DUF547 domain-containing protein [Psychrilyobacter sp. S5]REI42660.1 DUF547 domain-containing protein [Psychrilyobacter piezotolerans]